MSIERSAWKCPGCGKWHGPHVDSCPEPAMDLRGLTAGRSPQEIDVDEMRRISAVQRAIQVGMITGPIASRSHFGNPYDLTRVAG